MIIFILITLITIITIYELADYEIYGGFLSKEKEQIYLNLDKTEYYLNPINIDILMLSKSNLKHMSFISKTPFSILSKYYIYGDCNGRIMRWSKLHKQVEQYYMIANEK